jgi:hypothetical protein
MAKSEITLHPVLPSEYSAVARLETEAFWDHDFSSVAFGALRGSDAAITGRAASFAKAPKNPRERIKYVKAVRILQNGREEIVGFAGWSFVNGKEEVVDSVESWEEKDEEKEKEASPWGPSANVKFCEEVFLAADESMMRSMEGDDYASTLLFHPIPGRTT